MQDFLALAGLLLSVVLVVGLLAVLLVAVLSVLALVLHLRWHSKQTGGDRYFARTLNERRAVKHSVARQSKYLLPMMSVIGRILNLKMLPTFFLEVESGKKIAGPAALASKDSFRRCKNYLATENDIFIATQMKCGTTWMQQIVFQILTHGEGEFTDGEYRHMYAISPWIEMDPNGSVPLKHAPYISSYKKKIIKTHMPVELCPINDKAKYIYVTRHPASCFASMEDFVRMLTGPMCPSHENLLKFFNSEKMWWGPWIHHTENWWQESQKRDNVMFIVFEDLKKNTAETVQKIADFLQVDLSDKEKHKVLEKIDFEYMKQRAEYFEMAAPNIFSERSGNNLKGGRDTLIGGNALQGGKHSSEGNSSGFFVKGSNNRHEDLTAQQREDIIAYCKQELRNKNAAWLDYYPELKT